MILKEVHEKSIQHFQKIGIPSARLDADLLLAHALDCERIDLYTRFDSPLNENEIQKCRELIRRRSKKEPIAYILGSKSFFKSEFLVEPGVLIPRPETELMVEKALELVDKDEEYCIVDLGCGSGCIGLSLLQELASASLIAVDLSEKALEITRKNAERLDLLDRVDCRQMDLYEESLNLDSAKKHIVVMNPPYIAKDDKHITEDVLDFEPNEALFAPEQGLAAYKTWLANIQPQIQKDDFLLAEYGWQQKDQLRQILDAQGWKEIHFFKDLAEHDRYFLVRNQDG